jgi:hypothetical protein
MKKLLILMLICTGVIFAEQCRNIGKHRVFDGHTSYYMCAYKCQPSGNIFTLTSNFCRMYINM